MAILQISRITHRKGYTENLPQLAGAEFGWALDERRLFIGNGQVEDGAPVVGNTEILTEFSNILELTSTYTYKGAQAGYIVQTGEGNDDIVRSLQGKFDERVSVRDFGVVGDGDVDDTDGINRALYQLFCRETNTKVRRSLYFPAGTYKVTGTIKIPTYAKIFGDGITSSIIEYHSPDGIIVDAYVVEVADSKQQTGGTIGANSATMPTGIEVQSIGFTSTEYNSILLINSLKDSTFTLVNLSGGIVNPADLVNAVPETAAVRIVNHGVAPNNVVFDKCLTSGTTYGIDANEECRVVRFENGRIAGHFRGANIGDINDGNDPSGISISRSIFDIIANTGITFGNVEKNSSAFNVFYNVGNNLTSGGNLTPLYPNIDIQNGGNVSIGDLFERTDEEALIVPRIELNGQPAIAFNGTSAIFLGNYERRTGLAAVTPAGAITDVFTVNNQFPGTFKVDYSITRGTNPPNGTDPGYNNAGVRMGSMILTNKLSEISFDDNYTESDDINVALGANILPPAATGFSGTTVTLDARGSTAGDVNFKYSIVRLD